MCMFLYVFIFNRNPSDHAKLLALCDSGNGRLDCDVACWCMRCSACHSQATGSHIRTRNGNGHLGRTMSREGSTPEGHTRARDSNGHKGFIGKETSPTAPGPYQEQRHSRKGRTTTRDGNKTSEGRTMTADCSRHRGRTRTRDSNKLEGRTWNREAHRYRRITMTGEGIKYGIEPRAAPGPEELTGTRAATRPEMVSRPRAAPRPRMAITSTARRRTSPGHLPPGALDGQTSPGHFASELIAGRKADATSQTFF